MTQNFYQVNHSFSLFNPLQINASHTPKDIKLSHSNFILFPYIIPKSPYRTPPPSIPQATWHTRQQAIYDDLKSLSAQQLQKFLTSYQTFKHPSFGKKNPAAISNPFYQWVIRHNLSAWDVQRMIMDGNPVTNTRLAKPLWCQQRMGQSRTLLADGRIILIGGEYKDCYDPDFCIYNDVSVINTNGTSETYNYPKTVFPPTDFHTATLVYPDEHEHIIVIGSLGYPDERQYTHTPVYRLNTQNFRIEQVATRNSMGWICSHQATLKDNQIIVTGGQVLIDDSAPLLDNIDTWVLNLNTLIWKNTSNLDRKWQRFYVKRQNDGYLSLWEYRQLVDDIHLDNRQQAAHSFRAIEDLIGKAPDLDSYHLLFVPPIDHEVTGLEGNDDAIDYDHVLYIDKIKVGYKTVDDSCIQVIIEGKLSEDKLELLQQNLRHRLSKVENMACEIIDISSK